MENQEPNNIPKIESDKPEDFQERVDLSPLKEGIKKLREQIQSVVVGQERMSELILTSILSEGHILLEGVPGVAKTMTARLLSKLLNLDFKRLQFTPDLMPSDIIGTLVYSQKDHDFSFRKGPLFTNMALIDEINRAPAKTQAALFETMEEHQISVDGTTYDLDEPFMVIATQNPIEHEGTYRLPEAQLDRFMMRILIEYPTMSDEKEILKRHLSKQGDLLENISAVITKEELLSFRKLVKQIHIEDNILEYITNFVCGTRENPDFYIGASPRASIALMNASRAFAALQGRDFVTPDDVKTLMVPVLNHRVSLRAEREMEGLTIKEALNTLIKQTEVPR